MPEENFIEHQKKQKKLMAILVVILVIIIVVLYYGMKPPAVSSYETYNIKKPEINFNLDILSDPVLNALQPFTEIQPIDPLNATSVTEEIGRDNPFLPF
jgi:hypothetical protein